MSGSGTLAYRCQLCGPEATPETAQWNIVRHSDVVTTWACDKHLKKVMRWLAGDRPDLFTYTLHRREFLPRNQSNALDTVAWAHYHFGSFCTGRTTRRSTIQKLIKRGLVESAGMVALCDGDGFTVVPERYREGFRLTERGIHFAARNQNSYYAGEILKRGPIAPVEVQA